MYKDKNKQKAANKERQRRYKDRQKALPKQGVTPQKALLSEGVTRGVTREALPEDIHPDLPACVKPSYVCPIPEDQRKPDINYGPYMTASELAAAHFKANRVSKPGDDDYVPMCETTRAAVPVSDQPTKVYPLSIHKRGKDIKTFADLPPDVQATINRISQSNEEKQKRTKAAIKYQHLFPDRFHSTGIAQTAEIGELR